MNHFTFQKYLLIGLTTFGLLSPLGLHAQAPAKDPYADQYELISPPYPPATGGKVEVAEFFLYTCPHCYAFEDDLNLWAEGKPSYVEFVKIPAVFNENQILIGKTYYTAEMLGVLPKLHAAIFKAIHQDNRRLGNELELMRLFAENGVSNDDFRKAFHSFSVDMKVRQAAMITAKYGISGVPAMTVQGKYRMTSSKTGGHPQLLKLVDYLAQKESQLLPKPPVQTPAMTSMPSETKATTDEMKKVPAEIKSSSQTPSVAPVTTEAAGTTAPTEVKKDAAETPASTTAVEETATSSTPAETKESTDSKGSSETPKASDTPSSSDTQTKTTP